MAMQRELVSGKDLKEGDCYFPENKPGVICKITGLSKSKPGKHGAAKSISSGKDIFTLDNVSETFRDGQKVYQMKDPGAVHKVVQALSTAEIVIDLEATENNSLLVDKFRYGKSKLEERIKELFPNLTDSSLFYPENQDTLLVIKYSEIIDEEKPFVFWDLSYAPAKDLHSMGIRDEFQ